MRRTGLSSHALGLLLVLTVGLAGCSVTITTNDRDAAETGRSAAMADVMFLRMMIPHHEQAVEMSDIVLRSSAIRPETERLARDIRATQTSEIRLMKQWQEQWGWPLMPDMPGTGHGHMPGMISTREMSQLRRADGVDAERLFLRLMIEHHEGAISMARAVLSRGENPDVAALAHEIITSQTEEIALMRQLLQ